MSRLRIMLVAGEPSGDRLGARLMAALKLHTIGKVDFIGVGGETMGPQGLNSLFPMEELSVMGFVEVLPRARRILQRLDATAAFAVAERPDAIVTIDSPGFNFRLAKRLRGQGIPLIHFVAPQVWAWKPKRAKKTARLFDRLLCLLPFEPDWFTREGMAAEFVGHPVIESGAGTGNGHRFRLLHAIAAEETVLAILPGSRAGEVARHLPVFRETVERLAQSGPLVTVMPTVRGVAAQVRAGVEGWPGRCVVVEGEAEKFDAFAASDAALAASGTVALELALAGVPAVVAYRVNPVSAWLARRFITVRYVNLVNILLDRPAVPECLMEACNPNRLSTELRRLLDDPAARQAQIEAGHKAAAMLGQGDDPPSLRAAEAILRHLHWPRPLP
jgi:lipid-A-disaccharide synthase